MDETYVKVNGKWKYLYRAVDKEGNTIIIYWEPSEIRKPPESFLIRRLTVTAFPIRSILIRVDQTKLL